MAKPEMKITVDVKGVNTLVSIIGFAVDEYADIETLFKAIDRVKDLVARHGWDSFVQAFDCYRINYGAVTTPTELVWLFTEEDSLQNFMDFWRN